MGACVLQPRKLQLETGCRRAGSGSPAAHNVMLHAGPLFRLLPLTAAARAVKATVDLTVTSPAVLFCGNCSS